MSGISVIIISMDGYRDGNVPLLIRDIEQQDAADVQLIIIKGVSPVGKARNLGLEKTIGDIVIFFDDDIRLPDNSVIPALKEGVERHPNDLVGGGRLIPLSSTVFQRRAARELPRQEIPPPINNDKESDDIATYCWASKAELYDIVGRFREDITAGEDTEFRKRVRESGRKTYLLHDIYVYHPIRKNLKALIEQYFWYGKGTGEAYLSKKRIRPRLFKILMPAYLILRSMGLLIQMVFPEFYHLRSFDFFRRPFFNPLNSFALFFYYLGFACG